MEKKHPEKPFERYADDIVVHCKTEKQALFMLRQIKSRMSDCKLTLHPEKTQIVNLRGKAEKHYPKRFDFLGFTIKPARFKTKGKKIKDVGKKKALRYLRTGYKENPYLFAHWRLVHP